MAQFQTWRYDGVMTRYMFSSDPFEQQWVCRPQSGYWQVRTAQHELNGFAVIGGSAQTAGITYARDAVDLLVGLRPDLIGHKHGYALVRDVVTHARALNPHKRLRVSIPSWHLAALAVWQRAGFFPEYATIAADGTPVVVLL
jgi:GNAT superfamily N-acetyltransferase